MERGYIPAGGGHSLPAHSCTSRGGPPLLDGYQGLKDRMGHLGAKDHTLGSPFFMSLYERPSVFPLFFTAAITCPIFSFTDLKVAEVGLVRIPASRCRSQGPKDLGNWHRTECLWWFRSSSRASLKLHGWEEFCCCLCSPLSVPTRFREQRQPVIISSSQHYHLHHLSSLGLMSVLSISKCQDFYLLFFFFTAAITHLFLSLILILDYACPQTYFLVTPKMCT